MHPHTGPGNPPKYAPVIAGKYRDPKYDQGNDATEKVSG